MSEETRSNENDLLEYPEVAKRLCVSVRQARRLVAQRKLRVVDLGHRTKRFRPADVERTKSRLAGLEVGQ